MQEEPGAVKTWRKAGMGGLDGQAGGKAARVCEVKEVGIRGAVGSVEGHSGGNLISTSPTFSAIL